ncbi:hypothetical protein D3C80_1849300 [compost metagenome]
MKGVPGEGITRPVTIATLLFQPAFALCVLQVLQQVLPQLRVNIGDGSVTRQYLLQADTVLYPALALVVQVHQHRHGAIQNQRKARVGALAIFIFLP